MSNPSRGPRFMRTARFVELLFTLQRRLTGLGIKSPDMTACNSWLFWLPLVASWAETKSLRVARKKEPPSLDEPAGMC